MYKNIKSYLTNTFKPTLMCLLPLLQIRGGNVCLFSFDCGKNNRSC